MYLEGRHSAEDKSYIVPVHNINVFSVLFISQNERRMTFLSRKIKLCYCIIVQSVHSPPDGDCTLLNHCCHSFPNLMKINSLKSVSHEGP